MAAEGGRGALGPEFMASCEIEVGMPLEGKTCFRGVELQRFTGRVIGVERGVFAGGNLIWAELKGPDFGPYGVPAGMSGSPCYINGRLIGAVAYSFTASQKPIAGITPIESMLEVLALTSDKAHPYEEEWTEGGATVGVWGIEELKEMARSARPPGSAPFRIAVDCLPEALRAEAPPESQDVELKPLSIPIGISRCAPEVCQPLEEFFAQRGLSLVQGGVGGGTLDADGLPPLEAGSALGMPLMTGDLTIGGYGTVTYRQGNRLIAFGHPAFGWGEVDIPLSPCSMFAVNPSYSRAFKVGQVATAIGSIRQDREFGIGGVLGRVPRHIPMRVRVRTAESGRSKEFNYRVWDNRYLTPMLMETGVAEAFAATDRTSGDATLSGSYTIQIEGAGPIRKRLFYATANGPLGPVSDSLFDDLSLLTLNPFRKAKVLSLEADFEVSSRARQAAIVSVTADKEVYRPGEAVQLTLYVQPYRGKREKRLIQMPLPADLRDDQYELLVGDSAARLRGERDRAPGLFTPMNYEQLLEAIRKHYVGNDLYVVLSHAEAGLTVHGQELPSLPSSLRSSLSSTNERAFIRPVTARFLAERVVEGPTEFVGSAKLTLQVSQSGRR